MPTLSFSQTIRNEDGVGRSIDFVEGEVYLNLTLGGFAEPHLWLGSLSAQGTFYKATPRWWYPAIG